MSRRNKWCCHLSKTNKTKISWATKWIRTLWLVNTKNRPFTALIRIIYQIKSCKSSLTTSTSTWGPKASTNPKTSWAKVKSLTKVIMRLSTSTTPRPSAWTKSFSASTALWSSQNYATWETTSESIRTACHSSASTARSHSRKLGTETATRANMFAWRELSWSGQKHWRTQKNFVSSEKRLWTLIEKK